MSRTRIAQFGLGPIGLAALRLAATKPWIQVVGGIDIDPAKAGRTLGELTNEPALKHARVFDSFDALRTAAGDVDVVLHTAGSRAEESFAQMEPVIRAGVSVASTCEQLLYPQLAATKRTAEIDELCLSSGARIVGTGVNPGYVLDVIPVCLTGVSLSVDRVYGERVVNASTRRMPLQKKIGSGMDPRTFSKLFAEGKAGHAGFRESAALIAHCLGWPTDDIRETCEPVVAERTIKTDYFTVDPGQTCGLHQVVRAFDGETERITLDLKMYLDAPDPHDLVRVEGNPPLEVNFNGGVAGDQATIAALINVVPRLLQATPGVKLMTDLAVPAWA